MLFSSCLLLLSLPVVWSGPPRAGWPHGLGNTREACQMVWLPQRSPNRLEPRAHLCPCRQTSTRHHGSPPGSLDGAGLEGGWSAPGGAAQVCCWTPVCSLPPAAGCPPCCSPRPWRLGRVALLGTSPHLLLLKGRPALPPFPARAGQQQPSAS